MGSVIDLASRRQPRRRQPAQKPSVLGGQHVRCVHCGERHPIARLKAGEIRCVSAFFDGTNWFCLHGGCRRAWLAKGSDDT